MHCYSSDLKRAPILAHYKKGHEVKPEGDWDQVHIFSRQKTELTGVWHQTGQGVGSVGITREGIFREEHMLDTFDLVLGPVSTIPANKIEKVVAF